MQSEYVSIHAPAIAMTSHPFLSSPAVGDVGGEALKALAGKQSAIVQENLILKSMVALSTQTPATSGGTPPSTSPTPPAQQGT